MAPFYLELAWHGDFKMGYTMGYVYIYTEFGTNTIIHNIISNIWYVYIYMCVLYSRFPQILHPNQPKLDNFSLDTCGDLGIQLYDQ
jgi:hypothetical protein